MDKKLLRQHFRAQRQALSSTEQLLAAKQLLETFRISSLLSEKTFACYLAQDAEVDLSPLIEFLWQIEKTVCLPSLMREKTLRFVHYDIESELKENKYHIPEPVNANTIEMAAIDVIFMPLVAFDERHHRLGMGGGFYDRTLAQCGRQRPKLIGVAHKCQQAEALPVDDWDVPLDLVLSV